MSSTAPSPASTPSSPPSNSTASPPPAAPAPATPSAPPPVTLPAPPPATPSSPPPATPIAPPPATPSPPPTVVTAPPPGTATPSPPPPATTTPSPPPASTPTTPSPPPSSSTVSPPPPASVAPSAPSAKSPPPPLTPATKIPPPPARSSPTTPATKSPPPPARSSPTTPSGSAPSSSGGGVSTGLVVGVALAAGVVLVLLSLLFLCCRKKRRRYDDEYDAQGPPRPPPLPYVQKDNNGGPPRQWQYNAPPPVEQVVNVVPKPNPAPPPPPPPPFMNSSGGSGLNYSGSEQPFTPPSPVIALGFSKSTFTYEELMLATNGFSDANLLGQGGFGYVHKGVLPNGKEVAVKKLKAGSGQGEREFQAEVEIISRVHHKHLVSLVGYCITGSERMLVYEFVPNNTPTMDWPTRLKIALGSAKGLAYLHEDCHPKIIHRDIKAANILLDFKFEAKVADFGLAKFTSDTNTHVSTRVMGTFGYLAPEYASSGKLTEKSDVFSYGVMLLELITGRRPVDTMNKYMDDSLVDWARPQLTRALEDGTFDSLADPKLQSYYNHREMARMVACAAACVRHSAGRRPRMSQVVRALEGDVSLSDLNEGIRPGQRGLYSSHGSSDYDNSQYNNDLKKLRKTTVASQEYGSSEYSEPTSEYGVYPSGSSGEQTTREMEMSRGMKGSSSQGWTGAGRGRS
ncbi:hypothetical protein MLD38_006858 [Melastoma candidum]|uniref:Uncharacterized protein n=1 Tax=Melastoma candidum TaxID=119954 RepID=A0ACB9RP72_9MYRT|nr:hypothetical protein MLD38_006858 [Melastoma candidum]